MGLGALSLGVGFFGVTFREPLHEGEDPKPYTLNPKPHESSQESFDAGVLPMVSSRSGSGSCDSDGILDTKTPA